METDLFNDLVDSLKEAKQIKNGIAEPTRRYVLDPIDVKAVRSKTGLTQNEFADLMHISKRTLQNWEQHRRTPTEPAAALLRIVEVEPELALRSLQTQ